MNKDELNETINQLLPKLNGVSYSLALDKDASKQLLVDSFTLFIMKNKSNLKKVDLNTSSNNRLDIKKLLFKELVQSLYDVFCKRSTSYKTIKNISLEYKSFSTLKPLQRAIFYLKAINDFSINNLQETFEIPHYRIMEILHSSRSSLMIGLDPTDFDMKNIDSLSRSKFNFLTSYAYQYSALNDREKFEAIINESPNYLKFYNQKLAERDFIYQLIPDPSLSKNEQAHLNRTLTNIIIDIFPKESLINKTFKYLNEPIIEI